ncbi:uncharacterized protein LOC143428919 [Xylocopa sonorina]|uniref:uncharacterized protein LOC143428919 n=1 Tax=Xylocopa sonorina TaxID=1818115 RepID=UPI00403AEE80
MMKYVAILFAVFVLARSQRPPYAGVNKPYPGVLPQFLDEQVAASAVAASAAAPSSVSTTIGSRVDAENAGSSSLGSTTLGTTVATSTTIPPNLPVDALGDIALINKIKTWPREKQPFWYLNWQQIQEHRGDPNNRVQPVQTQPNTRSFFAG